jgi:flagellar protein FlgJ
MDIGAVGARYFEENRYDPGNLPLARSTQAGGPSFAEYLEKAGAGSPDRSGAPAGTRKPVIDKDSKLYEQCQELQTFLVKNLLTGMRRTIQKSGLVEEGLAGKFYEDMLWDEYAKDFSRNAGFGLAELAYLDLTGQRGSRPR